jgi:hypothetical protein
MTQKMYATRRASLVREFYFLQSKHCHLSAKARIRQIAKLDFEFSGIPIEETKQLFNYDRIR